MDAGREFKGRRLQPLAQLRSQNCTTQFEWFKAELAKARSLGLLEMCWAGHVPAHLGFSTLAWLMRSRRMGHVLVLLLHP